MLNGTFPRKHSTSGYFWQIKFFMRRQILSYEIQPLHSCCNVFLYIVSLYSTKMNQTFIRTTTDILHTKENKLII